MSPLRYLPLLFVVLFATGCGFLDDVPRIEVTDLEEGTGTEAILGTRLYVHYIGKLEDGTVFDASCPDLSTACEGEEPFDFVLGARQVIEGWEQGLQGMKVGGLRRLEIPPGFAYGSQGVCGVNNQGFRECRIPPNATLTFDVRLLDVTDI